MGTDIVGGNCFGSPAAVCSNGGDRVTEEEEVTSGGTSEGMEGETVGRGLGGECGIASPEELRGKEGGAGVGAPLYAKNAGNPVGEERGKGAGGGRVVQRILFGAIEGEEGRVSGGGEGEAGRREGTDF